jgi:hypothetical protein
MHRMIASLLLVASTLDAAPVHADAGPKLPTRAFYLSPGLTFGGSYTIDSGTHVILGGEVSMLYWHRGVYVGFVADGLYDWRRGGGRTMLGPMIGWGPVGIDGGYLLDAPYSGVYHGGAVRAFFSVGIVALFVRYGALKDAPDFVDFGLLIKIPLPLWAQYPRRPMRRDREPTPVAPPPSPAQPPASGPYSAPQPQ